MFLRLLPLVVGVLALKLHAAPPSQWDWVNPLPHRQTWIDIAAGPNGFVGITDGLGGRAVYQSPDGTQWQLANFTPTGRLSRIVSANGYYILVGAQELIAISQDGLDWQVRHTEETGAPLLDVAFGNGVYVAVGYNSIAYVSKDLKTWTGLNFPAGFSLLNVEFGNGIFVAMANSGLLYRSADGRVWNAQPWPTGLGPGSASTYEAGLAFASGNFVLSWNGGTAVSADAINWSVVSQNSYKKICASADGFIGIRRNSLEISSDGATWQTIATAPGAADYFTGAAEANGKKLAVGSAGLLYASSQNAPWQSAIQPIDYTRPKLAHANGAFIRYGETAGNYISIDGATWTFNAATPALTALAGGNAVWVGITEDGSAAISTDGRSLTEVTLPATPSGDLLSANGRFLIPCEGGGVLVSSNGKDWNIAKIDSVTSIRLIGFENGVFVAVSNNSEPLTSLDGQTWTKHAPQLDMAAQFYSAGNGRFVGIGGGGMGPGFVTISTDGAHWQRQPLTSGSTYSYTGLQYGGGYFVMIDAAGGVYYSPDAITWLGGPQAAAAFTSCAYGDGTWLISGGDSILRSSARVTARSGVTLQLAPGDFSTWNLLVSGSAGEHWRIEASSAVNASWTTLQSVSIPAVGRVSVPLPGGSNAAFFRAVIEP